jgi:hypothetical protein
LLFALQERQTGDIAMKNCSMRLGLSLMVMVSVWTHGLSAQEKIAPPNGPAPEMIGPPPTPALIGVPPPNSWALFVVPEIPYDIDHHDPLPPPFELPPPPGSARHRLMQLMNQQGYGCTANNGWGCSNTCYDLHFFFGSCRDFFGERCDACQLPKRQNPEKRWP